LSSSRLKTFPYEIQSDGALADERLHCELGPDGMPLDTEGNFYLTGKGVIVFEKTGEKTAQIEALEP
jgi:gluconolactonase